MRALCQTAAVTISREGQFFLVEPPCEDLLGPILQTRAYHSRVGLDGAPSVKRRRTPLYEITKTWAGVPVLKFWARLDQAVFTILEDAQVNVKRRGGVRHAHLPLPAWNKQLPDRPFLEHIAQHDRGLIRCNAEAFAPAPLIAQVARAWPDLNITIVCSRRDDVINLAKQLRAAKIDAFGFTARNQPRVKARVAVCTFAGMAYNPTEIEKQNIIIVLDAVTRTSKEQGPSWASGMRRDHLPTRSPFFEVENARTILRSSRRRADRSRLLFTPTFASIVHGHSTIGRRTNQEPVVISSISFPGPNAVVRLSKCPI